MKNKKLKEMLTKINVASIEGALGKESSEIEFLSDDLSLAVKGGCGTNCPINCGSYTKEPE